MLRNLLGALALLLVLGIPASADSLTFTLDQTTLSSPPGGIYTPESCQNSDGSGACVIFTGSISTAGDVSQDYFLDGLYVTMSPLNPDGGGVNVLDNTYGSASAGNYLFLVATGVSPYYGLLGPDAGDVFSYSGDVFEVDVLADAASGAYSGTATIDFTDEGDCANGCTASTPFTVVVTPEPGALTLAATGLAALAVMRRRFSFNAQ